MKNSEDKNLEKLVKNLMAETGVESPSAEFTSKVMVGIFSVEKNKTYVYKPVISNKVWIIILSVVVTLFVFLIFKNQSLPVGSHFNLSFLNSEKLLKAVPEFQFSTLTATVLLSASVMIFIQAFLLKTYLVKKFK